MTTLAFANGTLEKLRAQLLADSPKEAAAVLLAGSSSSAPNTTRVLVRESAIVPPDGYLFQGNDRLEISPSFFVPFLKRARNDDLALVFAHSHPVTDNPRFSLADDNGEAALMPVLFARARGQSHGSLILGRAGQAARLRSDADTVFPVSRFADVGVNVRISSSSKDPHFQLLEEFDRSVRAFGESGQRRLSELVVGVVGAGGTGTVVIQQLAHLGVRKLIILDPDVIDVTNLNRQVGSGRADVRRPKVSVAADMVGRIRNQIEVIPIQGSTVRKSEALPLLGADIIFCCTDNHGSRAFLNQLAYQYFIPTFDVGVRIDAESDKILAVSGRAQMLSPGLPCLVCQNLLDPEAVRRDLLSERERLADPYIVGAHEPQPAVISLNSTVASLAVTMLLGAVTSAPFSARHQLYLADRGVVRSISSSPQPNCVVCSLDGAFGRGDSWPLPWRLD